MQNRGYFLILDSCIRLWVIFWPQPDYKPDSKRNIMWSMFEFTILIQLEQTYVSEGTYSSSIYTVDLRNNWFSRISFFSFHNFGVMNEKELWEYLRLCADYLTFYHFEVQDLLPTRLLQPTKKSNCWNQKMYPRSREFRMCWVLTLIRVQKVGERDKT